MCISLNHLQKNIQIMTKPAILEDEVQVFVLHLEPNVVVFSLLCATNYVNSNDFLINGKYFTTGQTEVKGLISWKPPCGGG